MVSLVSAVSGLASMMPVLPSHSATLLPIALEPGTGWVGPMYFMRARITPPSRAMLLSFR